MNAIFSPEGKQFQVQYAQTAVDNSETILGVKCKDGIIVGCEKQRISKLLSQKTSKRIYNINEHIGAAIGGLLPDGRLVVDRAIYENQNYTDTFAIPITGEILADRVGQYVHNYTQYSGYRPLGQSLIIASYNEYDGYKLHMVESSGLTLGYHACTAGKGKQTAKAELEKRDFKTMTVKEALPYVLKTLNLTHEEFKDKEYEFEVSWICGESQNKHQLVPEQLRTEAEKRALEMIEEDEMAD
ncbi:hypothetical protein PPERSA_00513 [Pseudocohnilembus persalinus]|uniref:Proteasome alpha-type subunits domain-containing protein n=1 Tax=Pseudocohnilembus persalinus TaxID=266149 RepID=A0A0V0QI44_PSEPJ|nr:hypothetical protein PPERSA_00513 [Pseudocohnilembus persalinus]|eukprot:KRX01803.1 hypothetical protein PPERSA_00513 [Pseudocohnilembus persalinus]